MFTLTEKSKKQTTSTQAFSFNRIIVKSKRLLICLLLMPLYQPFSQAQTTVSLDELLANVNAACPSFWEDVKAEIDIAQRPNDLWINNTADRAEFIDFVRTSMGTAAPDDAGLNVMADDALTVAAECTTQKAAYIQTLLIKMPNDIITAMDAVAEGFGVELDNYKIGRGGGSIFPTADYPRCFSGLIAENTDATSVSVNADVVKLRNTDGISHVLANVSLTADITKTGIGGLDTGVPENDRFYYKWVISDGEGDNQLILSASDTAPILPEGYIFAGLVGAVKRDAEGGFLNYTQRNRLVQYTQRYDFASGLTASTYTAQDVSANLPIAVDVNNVNFGTRWITGTHGVVYVSFSYDGENTLSTGGGANNHHSKSLSSAHAFNTVGIAQHRPMPINGNLVYYKMYPGGRPMALSIHSYELNWSCAG